MSNKTNNEKLKYLIRKNYILEGGLTNIDDTNTIIPFDNQFLKLGIHTDPTHVEIATMDAVGDEIAKSLLNTHKQIIGDIEVSSEGEATNVMTGFNIAGGTLQTKDGSVYSYPGVKGDVFFFVKKLPTDTFKTEEAIILSDGSLDILSTANEDAGKLDVVDQELTELGEVLDAVEAEDANNLKVDNAKSVSSTGAIDEITETDMIPTREDVRVFVAKVKGEVQGTTPTKTITQLEQEDVNLGDRISAIELGQELEDIVWTGDTPFVTNKTQIILPTAGNDNRAFDFTEGRRVEVVIKDNSDGSEYSEMLTVKPASAQVDGTGYVKFMFNATDYIMLKLIEGELVAFVGWGPQDLDLSGYSMIRVVEALVQKTSILTYTKAEADAKFAGKSVETSKQDATDTALSTTTDSVVGAINEVFASAKNADTNAAQALDKQVTGDRVLDDLIGKVAGGTQTGGDSQILATVDYVKANGGSHTQNSHFKGEFDIIGDMPDPASLAIGDYVIVGTDSANIIEYTITNPTGSGNRWSTIGARAVPAGVVPTMNAATLLTNAPGSSDPTVHTDAFIGSSTTINQHYGSFASGDVSLGADSSGHVSVGDTSTGSITIGADSVGTLEIGSTHHSSGANAQKLIAGTKSATFEQVIDSALASAGVSHNVNPSFRGEYPLAAGLPSVAVLGDYAFVGIGTNVVIYEYVDSTGNDVGDKWETANVAAPAGGGNAIDDARLLNTVPSDSYGVSIGDGANDSVDSASVAIGSEAGSGGQGSQAIAIGEESGQGQGDSSIAIGVHAGYTGQEENAIAIGEEAGNDTQGYNGIAIGKHAAQYTQGVGGIAIGNEAGNDGQIDYAIAIGAETATSDQQDYGIAIGYQAAQSNQGPNAIAIGQQSGNDDQPDSSIAIGFNAHVADAGDIYIGSTDYDENAIEMRSGKLFIGGKEVALTFV